MKTFKDLKLGDTIYYWDKGKLHEQIVNKCQIEDKETKWSNYREEVTVNKYQELVLQAGKGKTYSLRWSMNDSTSKFGGMKRFACKEAFNEWVIKQQKKYQLKVNKLSKKLERYKKILSFYSI